MPIASIKQAYKLGLVCSNWTPQLRNRALRDVLIVSRLARSAGVEFRVAADPQFGQVLDVVVGGNRTTDMLDCSLYRVYVDKSIQVGDADMHKDPLEMVPEDCENFEVVEINIPKDIGGLTVEKDPYAGTKLFRDWQNIPPTIDLDKPAPPWIANDEPMFSPYL